LINHQQINSLPEMLHQKFIVQFDIQISAQVIKVIDMPTTNDPTQASNPFSKPLQHNQVIELIHNLQSYN
jgi:hypothetical protein